MSDEWKNDFIKCFDGVSNKDLDIEKGFTIKHQNLPTSIYKFRTLNDFSLDNLSNNTLWLTSPSKYNDPYDSGATLSFAEIGRTTSSALMDQLLKSVGPHLSVDELKNIKQSTDPLTEIAIAALRKEKNVPQDKVEQMAKTLINTLDDVMEKHASEMVDFVRNSLKICSFCSVLNPMLMWTHYAGNHQGFCMEYEVSTLPGIVQRLLFPVIYNPFLFDCTKYFAEAINNRENFNNIYVQIQALYKSPEWSYEKEWRLVFPGGVIESDMNYPIGAPKRVYLGARMSDSDRRRVHDVCKPRNIEVHVMKLTKNKFELTSVPAD